MLRATVTAWKRPGALHRFLTSWFQSDVNGRIPLQLSIDGDFNPKLLEVASLFKEKIQGLTVRVLPQHRGLKEHILICLTESGEAPLWMLEEDCIVHPFSWQMIHEAMSQVNVMKNLAGISTYAQPHIPGTGFPFYPLRNGSDFYYLDYPSSSGGIWFPLALQAFNNWMKSKPEWPKTGLPPWLNKWPESSWKKWMAFWMIIEGQTMLYPYEGITTNMGDAGVHHLKSSHQFQGLLKQGPWRFPDNFSELVRYDAWFEWSNWVWKGEAVNMNLWGQKPVSEGLWVIPGDISQASAQFGWELKPVEMNFILNMEGKKFSLIKGPFSQKINKIPLSVWWRHLGFEVGRRDLWRMGFGLD